MNPSAESPSFDRREILQIAASAVLALAPGEAVYALPQPLAKTVAGQKNWKPVFLTAQQSKTVSILTEVIIPRTDTPGANDAKVHRFIDLFLSVASPADQRKFQEGLAWLDEHARGKHRKAFASCRAAEQQAMLENVPEAGRAFVEQTKRMTAAIYFATEEGLKELNRGGGAPATFGCQHPQGHGVGV